MTIGAPDYSGARLEDFQCLQTIQSDVENAYPDIKLELSMGMSKDFQNAIKNGSDSVRVGTYIFGMRLAHASSLDAEFYQKKEEEEKGGSNCCNPQ